MYLVYLCVPPSIMAALNQAITHLLHCVYGIKLKWELHGSFVAWCEGKLCQLPSGGDAAFT